MPIKAEIFARAKTEDTRKHIEQLFEKAEFVSCEDIFDKNHEIIIFELQGTDEKGTIAELLRTNNFFLFVSDEFHDELLLELSQSYYFGFTLKSDPVSEIEIRFNTLRQHKDMKRELETKSEELESTIFELAFASTNVLEQNEFLEQMAKKDGLTLLYNHSYFKDKLKDEIIRSERYGNLFCLGLFDLDFFKKVNDNYGHLKGDEVLRTFAAIIKDTVRTTDIAARYGGEEFAVIFTETDLEHATMAIERIRQKLADTVFSSETDCFKITFSAGLTPFHKCYKDVEFMVGTADKALYLSKSTGRNKTTILKGEDVCG